jgi:hypothetical protein
MEGFKCDGSSHEVAAQFEAICSRRHFNPNPAGIGSAARSRASKERVLDGKL